MSEHLTTWDSEFNGQNKAKKTTKSTLGKVLQLNQMRFSEH